MDIKFEDGIPLPERLDKSKYQYLDKMKVVNPLLYLILKRTTITAKRLLYDE